MEILLGGGRELKIWRQHRVSVLPDYDGKLGLSTNMCIVVVMSVLTRVKGAS